MIDDIKTFAAAGADTTSSFLTSILINVYSNPLILEKVKK